MSFAAARTAVTQGSPSRALRDIKRGARTGLQYTAVSRKVVGKNVHATTPKGNMGYEQYTVPDTVAVEYTFASFLYHSQTYDHGLSCHSFKFLCRTVNSKPPTIPFEIVACTFSDNLSRNSCIQLTANNDLLMMTWKCFIMYIHLSNSLLQRSNKLSDSHQFLHNWQERGWYPSLVWQKVPQKLSL